MTPEQRAAFIIAQSVAMWAEMEGMKATNITKQRETGFPQFELEDFRLLILKFGLGHNDLIKFFQG